jgi:FkbM family methyltransferase
MISTLMHPRYRHALLSYGVAPSIEHRVALKKLQFDTVIDVGGNKGQFALFSRVQFPSCKVVSFEPLDDPAKIYTSVFQGDRSVRLVRAAIANQQGMLTMHITEHNDSSSPLKVGDAQHEIFGTKEVGAYDVACGPLSDFITESDLEGRSLLKIDVQGFELEVLRGSVTLLSKFDAIYCELSFIELYAGQPLAAQIIAFLSDRNFRLAGIYNISSSSSVGQVQADALFLKSTIRQEQASLNRQSN